MAGANLRGRIGAGVGLCAMASGALMLGSCDMARAIARPEVRTCQRFIQSRMKQPGSFQRDWFNVADTPVTRAMLVDLTGDPRQANAVNPGLRRVFVQYEGSDNEGKRAPNVGYCWFPLSDAGKSVYASDIEAAVSAAIRKNEERVLGVSVGGQIVAAADCCLREGVDLAKLEKLPQQRRGTVTPARKM